MRSTLLLASLLFGAAPSWAYIEAPHSLGKCVNTATNIVLIEVTKVNNEKNLIIFKKVADLKGKHNGDEIKHNIGKKGFHEREWKNIMAWAAVGKKAVFMYNNEGSETCIDKYWYQAYKEGEWWGMSHAEPFLLRTYFGDPEKLAVAITKMLKNEEVEVPCLADGNKEQMHLRKGKVQLMKASLKKNDYDPKKDFVAWGGGPDSDEPEFKTVTVMAAGAKDWRYVPATKKPTAKWNTTDFDDSKWALGKAPIGYGEDEIKKRSGTEVADKGTDFYFRREFELPADLLKAGNIINLLVASDDNATVWINGELADKDPEADHEFAYWNRDVEVPLKLFKPGKNLVAVYLKNQTTSSDLYLDIEIVVQIPVPKPPKKKDVVVVTPKDPKDPTTPKTPVVAKEEPRDPTALVVDAKAKTVTINGVVAPRKLPSLDQIYPIEVIGTYASPRGQKAHETVVNFKGVKPSELAKALTDLGLKPGKPAYGEGKEAAGPEVKVFLEIKQADGKDKRFPIEECLVHKTTGKKMPALKWIFTGSAMKQPDPEKDDMVYGADLTGTFLCLFPVTADTVLQTSMTLKDEPNWKLEVDPKVIPKEGTTIKLVLVVP